MFDVVFEDAEFVLAQVGDEAAGAILHRDWHDDLFHLNAHAGLLRLLGRRLRILSLRGRRETLLRRARTQRQERERQEHNARRQKDFS